MDLSRGLGDVYKRQILANPDGRTPTVLQMARDALGVAA
jgi:hypothetical protein